MRLFISYAHVDKAIVKDWIVNKLVAGGHNVWFDDRLVTGQDWKQQLSDAIQASDALVYCMTPESIASDWCQWELARAVDFGKPVIPVLLQARTNLPDQLKHLQYVDFSDGATGDAVARLMGGLQQLSPTQIPLAPQDPKGKPAQAVDQEEKIQSNRMMQILIHPAGQTIIGMLGIVITIIIAVVTLNESSSSDGNPTLSVSTPATPIVVALRNLDIRGGPGSEFGIIGILESDDSLDIRGITDDRAWYQVMLADGTFGWVIASESFGRFEGSRSVLQIVTPTATATNTPTFTPTQTPSHTPTVTQTPTHTPSATKTPTNTPSHTPTFTDVSTLSPTPTQTTTDTPSQTPTSTSRPIGTSTPTVVSANQVASTPTLVFVAGQYPCTGYIGLGGSNPLFVIFVRPISQLSPSASVMPGELLIILDDQFEGSSKWYQIIYSDDERMGWILEEYVETDECPE